MSRKDFELIANVIAEYRSEAPGRDRKENAGSEIASRFADALQATNPRFDRARFLKACAK